MTNGCIIPKTVHLQCAYSFLYNSAGNVLRRFVLPISIAQAVVSLGLPDITMTAVGLFSSGIAFIAILANISWSGKLKNPQSDIISSYRMMIFGALAGLFCIGLAIFISTQMQNTTNIFSLTWMGFALLFTIFFMSVSSNIWSVGFVSVLREQSKIDSRQYTADEERLSKAYMHTFMRHKSMGSSLGYFIAAALLLIASLPYEIVFAALVIAPVLLISLTGHIVKRKVVNSAQ